MAHQAISLFSGGGGIDCGLTVAGFETAVSVDMDDACAQSLNSNRCGVVLSDDVSNISVAKLLSAAGARSGDMDLLTAGPPCQPFSKSANWRYGSPLGLDDPRAGTLGHMMRLVEGLLPKTILIENVPGFGGKGPRAGVQFLETKFAKLNKKHGVSYRMSCAIVDAADYGVPQHRKRLIMVLDREGRSFEMPKQTHGSMPGLEPYARAWDAIGELDCAKLPPELKMRGRWADLLPSIPEGENYLWHTNRGGGIPLFGYRTRYWSFLLKLAKVRPAWTLPANPSQNTGPFHWKNRLLSAHEMARLQSFPDHWQIAGNRSQQVRQLGNAVPPLLVEVVAREISRQLLGSKLKAKYPTLVIGTSPKQPKTERAQRVDGRYLAYRGEHLAHPGHGLGPGALRRASEVDALFEA